MPVTFFKFARDIFRRFHEKKKPLVHPLLGQNLSDTQPSPPPLPLVKPYPNWLTKFQLLQYRNLRFNSRNIYQSHSDNHIYINI